MAGMIRRTQQRRQQARKPAPPKPVKFMTEDERGAFFADMRARTAAILASKRIPKAQPGPDPAAPDQPSDG